MTEEQVHIQMIVEMVGPAIEFLAQPLSDPFGALNSHWWQPPPQANTIQPRSPKTGPVEQPMNVCSPNHAVCTDGGFPGEWNTCTNFSTRGVTQTLWESHPSLSSNPCDR